MEHPTSPPVPENDALARDRSVTRTLAGRKDYLLYGLSLMAGALLSARLCFPERVGFPIDWHLGSSAMLFALPIAVTPLLLTLIFIGVILTPWRRELELGWIAAIGFPFAHRGYLLALKREGRDNALQLLLTFEHPPKQADLERLFANRLPGSKVVWQDERCVLVRSPPSAVLHRWFRRTAAPLLTVLHRDAGLRKVELRS